MSTFAKKVTSAVAGLAVVFSMVAPIAGVSAAYSSLDAANKLATLGVIVDNSANPSAYRLADTTSREELSKIIANLGGLTVTEGESVYSDTDFASWSEKYAKALNEAGYAASNEFFNPKNNATKIEALKWVMEARGIATGTGDNWMEARVNGAVEAGIATAFTDYNADASRGQVFIWAAEAIDVEDEVVVDDNLLCSILGTCEDDEEPTEPTTPVVPSGDDMLEVSLSPLSPTTGVVAADRDRTALLAIDVTAGDTDVELDEILVTYVGLSDEDQITNISVYRGNNEVSSSGRSFDSDGEAEISFENDTVIQAGQTVTLMITARVADAQTNSAHQIEVTSLEASSEVVMTPVRSVVFDAFLADNVAKLDFDFDTETADADLGEVVTFADFSLEEEDDEEDVILKSITFEFGGGLDAEDDVDDLVLTADGVVVADELMVNSDDEVVVDLEYVIAADDSVDFELEGIITGSIGDDVTVNITDIYAIGADTGIIAEITSFNGDQEVANFDINGAEFNVSFDKSDIDEAKPEAEDVLVGTLEVMALSDYTINELEVEVSTTGSGVWQIIDQIEFDGDAPSAQTLDDTLANQTATSVTFTFTDIDVDANMEEMFDLTFDVDGETSLNGSSITFDISIIEVEDEENDETFNASSTPDLDSVLSSNSFDEQTIDIESANFDLVQESVSDRTLVLGNGVEVVLYKGDLSVGDASAVTFNDINFTSTITSTGSYDLEDILDSATINIGGVTEEGDIEPNGIEFTGLDIEVAAGADNVEVLITAVLEDNDSVNNGDTLSIATAADGSQIDADDVDNEEVIVKNVQNTASATTIVMNDAGTFSAEIVTNGDFEDEIEDVVLAGSSNVILAEVEFEAEEEDMDVEEMVFTIAGVNKSTTIDSVRLMDGSTVLDTGVVTFDGTDTIITFEDFTIEDTGNIVNATVEADLEIITDEGGVTTAESGDIVLTLDASSIDVDGASSNDAIATTGGTTSSDAVSVTPVLVVASIVDTLGDNDNFAKVSFDLDYGNNDLDNDDVYLASVTFESLIGTALELRDEDGNLVDTTAASPTLTVDTVNAESDINDGDEYEFDANDEDTQELRVIGNGFTFFIDLNGNGVNDAGEEIKSFNDNTLNFGQFNEVN